MPATDLPPTMWAAVFLALAVLLVFALVVADRRQRLHSGRLGVTLRDMSVAFVVVSFLTSLVAIGALLLTPAAGLAQVWHVGEAAAIGVALTFPLLAYVARGLGQIESALADLALGRSHTLPTRRWWFPFTGLIIQVRALDARLGAPDIAEAGAGAGPGVAPYREELLRQTREAAAREERNRLARDLHDSVKQQLFAISVSAAAVRERMAAQASGTGTDDPHAAQAEQAARVALDDVQRSAREAQVEMEALLQQLRPAPLENIGLAEALRVQCEALGYRTGASVSFEPGALPDDTRLPPGTPEAVFRIAQEALTNIARHARASTVAVRLGVEDDELVLVIQDDGQGFDATTRAAGMGLANMRQRAGELNATLDLRREPGETGERGGGTTLRLRIPLLDPLTLPVSADHADAWRRVEQGQRALTAGMLALQLTVLFLLIGLPVLAIVIGTVITLGAGAWAMRARVAAERGLGTYPPQVRALRHRATEVAAWGLLLCGLLIWYLASFIRAASLDFATLALAGVLVAAALVAFVRWWRERERYLGLLRAAPLRQELDQSNGQAAVLALIWLIVVALGWIVGGFHPSVVPRTYSQWADAASLVVLVVWPLALVAEWLQTRHFMRRLHATGGATGGSTRA